MSTVEKLDIFDSVCDEYIAGRVDEDGRWYCARCGWSARAHEVKEEDRERSTDTEGG